VTWKLTASFDDEGRATGFFQFDNDKFQMSGNGLGIFDIVTTRGGKLAGTEYATGLFRSEGDATPFAMNITNDLGHLSFLHRLPLSDAGGIVSLNGIAECRPWQISWIGARSLTTDFSTHWCGGDCGGRISHSEGEIPRERHPIG